MALRGERPPIGLGWVITWPLSAVLAAVVFLAAEEIRHPQRGPDPTPAPVVGGDFYERLPPRIAAIDTALRKGPLRLAAPIEETRGAGLLRFKYRLYEVQLTEADRAKADQADFGRHFILPRAPLRASAFARTLAAETRAASRFA